MKIQETIQLIQLKKHQLARIHALAHAIWPEAFEGIISQAQIDYMLDFMYALPALEQQYAASVIFLIAFDQTKEQDIGFIGFEPSYSLEAGKIHKLYVRREARGFGLASRLIDQALGAFSDAGRTQALLTVNRYNPATAIYKHWGFEIKESLDTPIGRGFFMHDYCMIKDLD